MRIGKLPVLMKREAVVKGEFLVGLAARRDASRMSRHNQQRSVEEVRSLLGGTHAMKSVKPSIVPQMVE